MRNRNHLVQIAILLLSLASGRLTFAEAAQDPSFGQHIQSAKDLLDQSKFDEAFAEVKAASAVAPSRYEAPAYAAILLLKTGHIDEARSALADARKLASSDSQPKLDVIGRAIDEAAPAKQSTEVPSDDPVKFRKYNILMAIADDADRAALGSPRESLLEEFIQRSAEYLQAYPDDQRVWILRALTAVELDQVEAGYEAAHAIEKFGLVNSQDPKIARLVANLDRKGWFGESPATAAKRIASEKAAIAARIANERWLRQTSWESSESADKASGKVYAYYNTSRQIVLDIDGAGNVHFTYLYRVDYATNTLYDNGDVANADPGKVATYQLKGVGKLSAIVAGRNMVMITFDGLEQFGGAGQHIGLIPGSNPKVDGKDVMYIEVNDSGKLQWWAGSFPVAYDAKHPNDYSQPLLSLKSGHIDPKIEALNEFWKSIEGKAFQCDSDKQYISYFTMRFDSRTQATLIDSEDLLRTGHLNESNIPHEIIAVDPIKREITLKWDNPDGKETIRFVPDYTGLNYVVGDHLGMLYHLVR